MTLPVVDLITVVLGSNSVSRSNASHLLFTDKIAGMLRSTPLNGDYSVELFYLAIVVRTSSSFIRIVTSSRIPASNCSTSTQRLSH